MADLKLDQFRAGDTFKLDFDLDSYPAADGWSITYHLKGGQAYNVVGSVVNGAYRVEAAAATTENWAAGNYSVFIQLSKAGEKHTLELGQIDILAALSGLANYDGRSHVKKVLDALESLIEGKAASDVDSYSIAGRQLTKLKPDELLKWQSIYANKYRQELAKIAIAQGKKPSNNILVRF